jgi:hypothetical protein
LCSHSPEEICSFQWKASGETLKIQKPPATPTSIHKYKKYINPSGDPVPLRPSKIIHLVIQSLLPVRAERAGPLLKAGVHAAMPGHLVLGYANSSNPGLKLTSTHCINAPMKFSKDDFIRNLKEVS